MVAKPDVDVAIVGGGLSGCLTALAIARTHPDLHLVLIEEGRSFGGSHVWTFRASDIDEADRWLIAPLITHGWTGYDVHFPGFDRGIKQKFYAVTSDRLDLYVRAMLPSNGWIVGTRVASATPERVIISGGQRIQARCVIDARGPANISALDCVWQKFVGRHVVLDDLHRLDRPVLLDATVEQLDGCHFMRLLPFGPVELLIEDVYYSDVPLLDRRTLGRHIDEYAAARGWRVQTILREQHGVLPVVMGGKFDEFWEAGGRGVKVGTRAALLNAFTGYALPDAVRVACSLSRRPDFAGRVLDREMLSYATEHWDNGSFYRMAARMMYRNSKPEERYKFLERLYSQDEDVIARFYKGKPTPHDRTKILAARGTLPFWPAMRARLGGGRSDS